MNVKQVNLLNIMTLLLVGLWGYTVVLSPTALIPVFFGFVLSLIYIIGMVKPSLNKICLYISLIVTLVIFMALVGVRLPKSIDSGGLSLIRVVLMSFTSGLYIIYCIKSIFQKK